MTDDHDSRISGLYQQSSQETPPAHLDRAVMDMARKSVRRRAFSPFGNHWVAGGTMAAVVMLSVLLILTMPQQPDSYQPMQDTVAPSSEAPSERRMELRRLEVLPSELPAELEEKREGPAAPKPIFNFYETLPEMEIVIPEIEAVVPEQEIKGKSEAGVKQVEQPATYYLQVGSFRSLEQANRFRAELVLQGFETSIQKVTINNTDTFHRVRIGPFQDLDELNQSRQLLNKQGIENKLIKITG